MRPENETTRPLISEDALWVTPVTPTVLADRAEGAPQPSGATIRLGHPNGVVPRLGAA